MPNDLTEEGIATLMGALGNNEERHRSLRRMITTRLPVLREIVTRMNEIEEARDHTLTTLEFRGPTMY